MNFPFFFVSTASIFNLVLLSLDRYWAVVYPLVYLRNRTRKRATNFILIVWFISFLWAPAVIFWSSIIPEHSDIIPPNECDTSFRSNKLFKTLTALVNFYFPLLTMIIISCRIMVAIRSRSTMELGRRISSTMRKQTKKNRVNTSLKCIENENKYSKHLSSEDINGQTTSISIVINPFDSIIEHTNISSHQSDDNTDSSIQNNDDDESLSKYQSIHRKSFRLYNIKPIKILFPSLSSIKEIDKRQSVDLQRKYSQNKILKSSLSVSNNMKYSDKQSNKNNLSNESSFTDESSHTNYPHFEEQQSSIPTEKTSR